MTYATHVVDLLCYVQPCRQHSVCHRSQSASVVFSLGLSTIPHVIMYVSTTCFLAHADTFCTPHFVRRFRIPTAPATVSSDNFLFPASDSTILAVGCTGSSFWSIDALNYNFTEEEGKESRWFSCCPFLHAHPLFHSFLRLQRNYASSRSCSLTAQRAHTHLNPSLHARQRRALRRS